ncbi:ATP-binding protein [Rathayibacter sp. AY1C9]|nr:ATP-binding protein [Rathayibacter sp. AY1C1]PPH46790.1 ATP-binding protein [Rathayibacter sp. AY1C9]PPI18632.1 ATP-binding protein [Rathayibacter sp. AY1B6]PPI26990.1 ATP-binding protein [Rathayibacter sp. AY1B5]PPI29214.1 ATP-binding protein [Rathayibacter sp. AY1B1]
MMCGPAGAGKSTVARELAAAGMRRLSFDQEAWRRGIRTMPLPANVHAEIEGELRGQLLDLVEHGVDVVLDFSFWSRRSRMEYRELLGKLGVVPETIYLATPRSVALERMRTRRLEHADDYALPDEVAAAFFDHFEPPTADEGPLTIVKAGSR